MSIIHGPQYLMPLFLDKQKKSIIYKDNEELTLAFFFLTKDLPSNTRLISFSRLLWPYLSIQGVIGHHIILDGLYILKKEGKYTNPPRQPLIGHILRNIDNRTQIEQLKKIIEILSYKDKEAEEVGKGEESEYRSLTIEGLIRPEFLSSLSGLFPLIEYQPINEYMPLDTTMSIEKALDLAEKYRLTIEEMRGNAQRWDMQIDLIQKEIDKMLIDINVNIKETTARYDSQIKKISSTINNEQIDEKIKAESDKIDLWKNNEKKNLIENFSLSFKNIELLLEELIKNNDFFSNSEVLKTKPVEDLVLKFDDHINYLGLETKKCLKSIDTIKKKYDEFKKKKNDVEINANKKLKKYENNLNLRLQENSKQITQIKNEKIDLIESLNSLKQTIEDLVKIIKEIINQKREECLKEAEELKAWSIEDEISDIFSRPIQWIYMPVYALFYEEEDTMEEKMDIIFPGSINNESASIYKEYGKDLSVLRALVKKKIEKDMILRSNFEFSCENKNYFKDSNLSKKIQQALSKLRNIINNDQESKIRERINTISE